MVYDKEDKVKNYKVKLDETIEIITKMRREDGDRLSVLREYMMGLMTMRL